MARARLISTSIGSSRRFCRLQSVASLPEFSQLLFVLLVVNCDDFGRADADPFTVKLKAFPGSSRNEQEFEDALQALAEVGLIQLYDVDENRYLAVQKFEDHQSGLHKRTKSRFPDPPVKHSNNDTSGNSGKFPEIPASRARAEPKRREEKRRETKRKESPPNPPGGGNGLSLVFEAVAEACGWDLLLLDAGNAQKANLLIEDLRGRYDDCSDEEIAEMVRAFGRWYFDFEFAGHRATLNVLRTKWASFREYQIKESVPVSKRPNIYTDEAQAKLKAAGAKEYPDGFYRPY